MRTIDKIIELLGGRHGAAEALGVKPQAVSMWRTRGKIPHRKHYEAVVAMASIGYVFDPLNNTISDVGIPLVPRK